MGRGCSEFGAGEVMEWGLEWERWCYLWLLICGEGSDGDGDACRICMGLGVVLGG